MNPYKEQCSRLGITIWSSKFQIGEPYQKAKLKLKFRTGAKLEELKGGVEPLITSN